jgi:hypothetical protein
MQIRVLAAALSLIFAASCREVKLDETVAQVKTLVDNKSWPEAELAMKPLLDDTKLMEAHPRLNALAYLVKSENKSTDAEFYLGKVKDSADPAMLGFLARHYFDQKDYVNAALYYKNVFDVNPSADALKMLILSDYLRSGADIEGFVRSNGEGLKTLKASSIRSAEYHNLLAIDGFYNDPSNKGAIQLNLYKAKAAGQDHYETLLNMAVIEDAVNKRYGSAERFYNEYLAAAGNNVSPDLKAQIDARLIKLKALNKPVVKTPVKSTKTPVKSTKTPVKSSTKPKTSSR